MYFIIQNIPVVKIQALKDVLSKSISVYYYYLLIYYHYFNS
ncbi:unnamed protein product [Schistosoma mattheei]|uniref:Uncharacterized protein n=1 Tax=Schistosoma mattheei TaxID=31246 RepID=A0A183Q3D9_9TREM|nr:unnamed protein product [Schistosoma mattheei]